MAAFCVNLGWRPCDYWNLTLNEYNAIKDHLDQQRR
jgi:hypothetical protein